MSHGVELESRQPALTPPIGGVLGMLLGWQTKINGYVLFVSMLALLAACLVLTLSVVMRYFLKMPTDWQDEVSVFLLVGAVFLCGAYVQAERGHIGIGALEGFFSPAANRMRLLFCDIASLAFCAFFTWKTWSMLHEAVVEGQTTSSTWGPPLWIPYGLMAAGMTLLCLQMLLQILIALKTRGAAN
ncbi:tripartite ATP-independent periplasmic transporters, DctQ component [mine drainage metagenome]|uniref:Tripartite ATP-independent periplasmic transporters, DctQ component n=1 Tax=mine drainage metagenome TaxID=410659 RepID=A0A1J5TSZ6_9ZZZZ